VTEEVLLTGTFIMSDRAPVGEDYRVGRDARLVVTGEPRSKGATR